MSFPTLQEGLADASGAERRDVTLYARVSLSNMTAHDSGKKRKKSEKNPYRSPCRKVGGLDSAEERKHHRAPKRRTITASFGHPAAKCLQLKANSAGAENHEKLGQRHYARGDPPSKR